MVIIVYLEKTNKTIPFNNQHKMNGFVNAIIGKNNKYHDKYSDYSVSSILGGHISDDKSGLIFDEEPYIQVTSMNVEFLNMFIDNLLDEFDKKEADFFGLHPTRYNVFDYQISQRGYDVVKTNSPILLKDENGKKITCKDANWIDVLNSHCKKKLLNNGVNDNTFEIIAKNKSALRNKMIMVGETFNPCTNAVFCVYGRKNTRNTLYNLGIGNSTGSGFGSVSVIPTHVI